MLWDGAAVDLEHNNSSLPPVTVGLGVALVRTTVEPHRIRRDMFFIGQDTGGQRHRLNGQNRQQHAMRLSLRCRSYVRDMRREWATSRPPIVSVVCWREREDRASLSTVQHSWRHRAWDWVVGADRMDQGFAES